MIRDLTFTATAEDAGLRLDRVVARHCPGASRTFILDAIASGDILLNDRRALKGIKIRGGDRVFVRALFEEVDKRVRPEPDLPLQVIYQDEALIVLDKPAGMPVHPLGPGETGTLANALIAREPALADIGDDPRFPSLVHRLDNETSGLVVAARTASAYAFLRQAFHDHQVEKEYRALVRGSPPDEGRLQHYLAHEPANRGRMRVFRERPATYAGPRLMQAVTEFKVLERLPGFTLLSVRIPTGVTHQIRAQLAAVGVPVVADRIYGGTLADGEWGLTRHFLHAATIAFTHPASGKTVRFEAPLAAELLAVLAELRKR
ncbi:MAG: RluA family pseudouridine synthase [Lentisphaerae bacterium]|nr:RluA family pseudouridine synthase [Lentisphaerota bacterium]